MLFAPLPDAGWQDVQAVEFVDDELIGEMANVRS